MTIDDLAARLGISAASVSYALNEQPGVSDTTRARVKALAKELGWHPSPIARALSRSRSDSIGIILRRDPDLLGAEPYYMNLMAGVENVLTEADQTLLFRMVGSAPFDDSAVYRQWAAQRRVDGVLMFDHTVGDDRPRLLNELNIPFVAHGSRMTDIGGPTFVYDLIGDAEMITDHLHGLGHRHLVHISGSNAFSNELNRIAAMRRAAHAVGMTYRDVEGDYSLDVARRITGDIMNSSHPPTAWVTSNDVMAIGVAAELRRLDHEGVAVVAFDDSLLCRISYPTVTALERFTEEQGKRSTRMLLAMLRGSKDPYPVAMASVLQVRDSSVRPCVSS